MTAPEKTFQNNYQGFDLRSVCWGYRDIFEKSIDGLFDQGLLGDNNREVTSSFFDLLKKADQSCYDHVLKEFLSALNPRTRWLMDIPAIFSDVVETGHLLAEEKLYYGIGFFRLLGTDGLGNTPSQVQNALTLSRQLFQIDAELAFSFLQGYSKLLSRLEAEEIDRYTHEGMRIHAGNAEAGYRFMSGNGNASENIILMLTRECRLEDEKDSLQGLLHALTSLDVEVDDFSKLDSDDLIECGSRMIAMYRWLYLPARLRHFDSTGRNRDWYRLCTIVTAAMLAGETFCTLHGHPDFETSRSLVGNDIGRLNLFAILEYVRSLRAARESWPGTCRLIDFGLSTEFSERPAGNAAEILFQDAASQAPASEGGILVARISDRLHNTFATAAALDGDELRNLLNHTPALSQSLMRPYAFLPDFLFPGTVHTAPPESMIADMRERADPANKDNDKAAEEDDKPAAALPDSGEAQPGDGEEAVPARYWYPEWNQTDGEYYDNWCGVVPMPTEPRGSGSMPDGLQENAARVRRIFERLKPDMVRKERRLESGDSIDIERVISYRINRRLDGDPRIDFYEKPLLKQRDLAVLVLLDVSGSTGETTGNEKVLEVEKHAALILGQGLSALGDRFAIAGFSSNGREQCEYYMFKDFSMPWDNAARAHIMGAYPRNSTRIGAAVRHSGHILSGVESRQRLLLLVTDGKPMDSGYDPHTRYAQHDVRMACEENTRRNIATFAITTEENSLADMEIMFPQRRFAILPDIRRLPEILPRMYLRLTT